jgi:hypothetical protein
MDLGACSILDNQRAREVKCENKVRGGVPFDISLDRPTRGLHY